MTAAWVDRVRQALGPSGYYHDNNKFRKSLQTAVLYEAKRSVNASASRLKSYERKYALMQQAQQLLNELVHGGVVSPAQRDEVLWKTASSRQALDAETAWRRVKAIERELDGLAQQVRPFLAEAAESDDHEGGDHHGDVSHDDAVDRMVRAHYEANPTDYVKAYRDMIGTREWELTHNHLLFTFRLYYKGDRLDPEFPPPGELAGLPPPGSGSRRNSRASAAATKNPRPGGRRGEDGDDDNGDGNGHLANAEEASDGAAARAMTAAVVAAPGGGGSAAATAAAAAAAAAHPSKPSGGGVGSAPADPEADERRKLLREVKDHLELLREFEGIVPAEELDRRKRALFLALPPAPPPLPPPLPAQQQQPLASPQNSPSRPRRSEQQGPDPNGAKRSRT